MADINKNLDNLMGRFLPAAEAREAAEDVRAGDHLLTQYPAPLPDAALLAEIKARTSAVSARRRHRRHWGGRAIAAAAAAIVVGGVLLFFSGDAPDSTIPRTARITNPAPGWWDDSAVETLTAEVDDVLETMISISADDDYVEEQVPEFDESELEELERIAMNDDFWKG